MGVVPKIRGKVIRKLEIILMNCLYKKNRIKQNYKKQYESCTLCPRECHVNRLAGQKGYCHETAQLYVARASLHEWEEPCLSGTFGSGTVFFSGCSLGCCYCQNGNIASGKVGYPISTERLSEIFLEQQERKAHNINLVTAGHFIPDIIEAVEKAKKQGLTIPIVYNTSSYEKVETLKMLEGIVDIWLPDFKYMGAEMAKEYSNAPDYSEYAKKALVEMVRQAGKPKFDSDGIMKSGVIVRHLVLPEGVKDSKEVIKYLYQTYGNQIYLSIMNQYTPMKQMKEHTILGRKTTKKEYDEVVDYAIELGVEQGFIQEEETAMESFIPEFDGRGVFR